MLDKIKDFIKENSADIILVAGVFLISLLSFAAGYIISSQRAKTPIKFELNENSNNWRGNMRSLSRLEII